MSPRSSNAVIGREEKKFSSFVTTRYYLTLKAVVLCNMSKTYHSNSRKWPRKAYFGHIDRVNMRNEAETIYIRHFPWTSRVKHNRNELQ